MTLNQYITGLSRTRDSIGRATACALSGAACQAAPRIIRLIADSMEKETNTARRIDMLYLVDSVLQVARNLAPLRCGSNSGSIARFGGIDSIFVNAQEEEGL